MACYCTILSLQKRIMDYIYDESSESSLEEPINNHLDSDLVWLEYKSMPEKFAYGILSASSSKYNSSDLKQASLALYEWDFIKCDNEEDKCICGHIIHDRYWIRNRHTDQIAIVGSDCIHKLSSKDLNLWTQINFCIKSRQEHKNLACISCCKYKVREVDLYGQLEGLCKSCTEQGKRRPSKNYLTVKGIPCKNCEEKILASSKLQYCNACVERCIRCKHKMDPATVSNICLECEESARLLLIATKKAIAMEKSRAIQQSTVVENASMMSVEKQVAKTRRCHCGSELPSNFPQNYTRCWTCWDEENNVEVDTKMCSGCGVPIKKNNQGWTTCYKCSRKPEEKMSKIVNKPRTCQDCRKQLPDTHDSHWKRCTGCQFSKK